MFIDARKLGQGTELRADVCIVGGGAAGITLALELAGQGRQVCLLESGGLKGDAATLDLYRGRNVGIPYQFAGGCRSRYLGGSSNCWGGWCRPWDDRDFEARDWIAGSEWPIDGPQMRPYYRRAMQLLKLGPDQFDPDYWERAIGRPDVRRIPVDESKIIDSISQFSPPVRFGIDYHSELARSDSIRVHLWSNVTHIDTDEHARTVSGLQVRTLTGRSFRAVARVYVVATGGIENARLLLASNRVSAAGLGNAHDLVGRYFMDHPRLTRGSVKFRNGWTRNKLYDIKFHYQNDAVAAQGTRIASAFVLSPAIQRDEQLLGSRVWFRSIFPGEMTETVEALFRMKRRLQRMDEYGHTFGSDLLKILAHPVDSTLFAAARVLHLNSLITDVKMEAIVEPEPNRDSRVRLSGELDRLGMPRVEVDWRLGDRETRTFNRTFEVLAQSLQRSGVADVDLDPPLTPGEWPQSIEGTWHHMGTTRMHRLASEGVVDADCRVHGMSNLFVAGSSVFPAGGSNFPTITLVALAARLAAHLKTAIAEPSAGIETRPGQRGS